MATATYAIDTTLGASLDEAQQRYPSLQPTTYQPAFDSKVSFCLVDKSVDMLNPKIQEVLKTNPIQVKFSNSSEVQSAFTVPATVQWVFLGFPKTFMRNKKDKRDVRPLQKGFKLKDNGFESVTKLFLAAIVDGDLLLDNNGEVQVFTLVLNSTKTKLVEGELNNPDYRSLRKLNNWLIKKFNLPNQLWLHLASVPMSVKVETFSNGKDSSIGIMYVIDGMPTPLEPSIQKKLSVLANSELIKVLMADPFVVNDSTKAILNGTEVEEPIIIPAATFDPDDEF